jgi:quinol monooxygenase YgiN
LIRYSVSGGLLSFHFMVNFEPEPTKAAAFREELLRVIEPSGREPGCLRMDVFESVRQPYVFAIHSEWTDEAAFELHSSLPHTTRFISAAESLLGHRVEGLRLRQIGAGSATSKSYESA